MDNATSSKNTKACNCWVHHAITAEHRKQIADNLAYFRSIGDRQGTLISLAQLSPCPTAGG